jgi:hypothetical protein
MDYVSVAYSFSLDTSTGNNWHQLKEIRKSTGKLTLGKLIWAIRQADEMSQVDFVICQRKAQHNHHKYSFTSARVEFSIAAH